MPRNNPNTYSSTNARAPSATSGDNGGLCRLNWPEERLPNWKNHTVFDNITARRWRDSFLDEPTTIRSEAARIAEIERRVAELLPRHASKALEQIVGKAEYKDLNRAHVPILGDLAAALILRVVQGNNGKTAEIEALAAKVFGQLKTEKTYHGGTEGCSVLSLLEKIDDDSVSLGRARELHGLKKDDKITLSGNDYDWWGWANQRADAASLYLRVLGACIPHLPENEGEEILSVCLTCLTTKVTPIVHAAADAVLIGARHLTPARQIELFRLVTQHNNQEHNGLDQERTIIAGARWNAFRAALPNAIASFREELGKDPLVLGTSKIYDQLKVLLKDRDKCIRREAFKILQDWLDVTPEAHRAEMLYALDFQNPYGAQGYPFEAAAKLQKLCQQQAIACQTPTMRAAMLQLLTKFEATFTSDHKRGIRGCHSLAQGITELVDIVSQRPDAIVVDHVAIALSAALESWKEQHISEAITAPATVASGLARMLPWFSPTMRACYVRQILCSSLNLEAAIQAGPSKAVRQSIIDATQDTRDRIATAPNAIALLQFLTQKHPKYSEMISPAWVEAQIQRSTVLASQIGSADLLFLLESAQEIITVPENYPKWLKTEVDAILKALVLIAEHSNARIDHAKAHALFQNYIDTTGMEDSFGNLAAQCSAMIAYDLGEVEQRLKTTQALLKRSYPSSHLETESNEIPTPILGRLLTSFPEHRWLELLASVRDQTAILPLVAYLATKATTQVVQASLFERIMGGLKIRETDGQIILIDESWLGAQVMIKGSSGDVRAGYRTRVLDFIKEAETTITDKFSWDNRLILDKLQEMRSVLATY